MTDASDENSSGPVGENDQLIVSSADTGAREPATGTDPALFIALKAATLFLFVILAATDAWPCFGGSLALSVALVEFWVTKNINGLNLVGMRWSHEVGDSGDPRWIFYSRRDPYVPEPANAAIFWAVMFGSALTWVAVALTAVFLWSFFYALVAAVILAFEVVNTSCFVKCHAVSNRQADDVARAVLLGSPFDDGGEADTQLVVDE